MDKITITGVSKDQLYVDTKNIIYAEGLGVFLGATASNRHDLEAGGETVKFRLGERLVSGNYDPNVINNDMKATEIKYDV